MKTYVLSENGTLKQWDCNGTSLFFEEQWVPFNGNDKRLRGSAPVGCTHFGELPELTGPHEVCMPHHKLMHIGDKHRTVDRGVMETPLPKGPYIEWYHATFMEPWEHTAKIYFEQPSPKQIIHDLTIALDEPFASNYPFAPVSISLHPYFDTKGKPFAVEHGNIRFKSNTHDFNHPKVVLWKEGQPLFIKLGHGLIALSLDGGNYTHFCIWSDCPKRYVCVSPFLGHRYPYMLRSGEQVSGKCTMSYNNAVLYQ